MLDLLKKVRNRIYDCTWKYQHKKVRQNYINRYHGNEPTIICCNCIGGILYHELDLQFLSPTINLYMNCEDFIKFCEKLDHYLSLEILPYNGDIERDYPLGVLGDLLLYFVHYKSLDEAKKKWDSRKNRINWNNIYIIATDRDGLTEKLLMRFLALPYANKKIFTHFPVPEYKDVVYIKGYENEKQIEGLMFKTSGGHYLIDQFDWVNWLNGNNVHRG